MIRRFLGGAALVLVLLYALANPTSTAATLRHFGANAQRFVSVLIGGERG